MAGNVRVEQIIENLHPHTQYQLSGWLKVTGDRAPVILGVSRPGMPDALVSSTDKAWERKTVDFTTGSDITEVTVYLKRTSEAGEAFADNLGLPRNLPDR